MLIFDPLQNDILLISISNFKDSFVEQATGMLVYEDLFPLLTRSKFWNIIRLLLVNDCELLRTRALIFLRDLTQIEEETLHELKHTSYIKSKQHNPKLKKLSVIKVQKTSNQQIREQFMNSI